MQSPRVAPSRGVLPASFALFRTALLAVSVSLFAARAFSQELSIPLVATPPTLADFVSMSPAEGVRGRYASVTGFTQRTPQDGAPSTQRTDVYLGYDARNLYAVFLAFDDDPASVRANLAPRENIENDDRVGLLDRHVRRPTDRVRLSLEPARRAMGRPLVRGHARRV